MYKIETKEGKYLAALYDLCKRNILSEQQQGELKDMLICGDQRVSSIIENSEMSESEGELQKRLVELSQDIMSISDESYSIKSIPSQFKNKRPRAVMVNSNVKKWYDVNKIRSCKSWEHLEKKRNHYNQLSSKNLETTSNSIVKRKSDTYDDYQLIELLKIEF